MAIQPDYGGFNSRFLGIQLRFHAAHPEGFSEFIRFLGSTPDQVVALGNAALQASPERAFHVFSVATTLAHEMRHFHDFLLSPLSQAIFRLRVAAIFHGIQGVPDIKRLGFVPVPLTRWLRLPAEEQASRLRQWAGFLKNGPDVFSLSEQQRSMLFMADDGYLTVQRKMVSQRLPKIQPVHLFEASALLVQYHSIVQLFGEPHAAQFIASLYQHSDTDNYKLIFNMFVNLWHKWSAEWDFRAMSAVLTWSIAGAGTDADDDDYPTVRFLRLFHYLEQTGLPVFGNAVADWFAQWDAALGSVPMADNLSAAVAQNETLLQQLEENPPVADKLFMEVADGCLQAMRSLTTLSRQMLTDFQLWAEAYVDPAQYVNQEQFIACPIRMDFMGGGIEARRFDGSAFQLWRAITDEKGDTFALSVYLPPTGNNRPVTTEAILSTAVTLEFGDLLFNEFNRDSGDLDAIRHAFRHSLNVVPLEVF